MGCLPFLPALTEARDIYTHLAPLRRQLEDLESLEFPDVKPRLRPLLHVVCLIWATCESYRCPGRLTACLASMGYWENTHLWERASLVAVSGLPLPAECRFLAPPSQVQEIWHPVL